jgi:dienelactone hydrolase
MKPSAIAILALLAWATPSRAEDKQPIDVTTLPKTEPLTMKGDIASELVAGVDRFLLKQIEKSVEGRAKFWNRDFSSPEAYNKSIEPNRKRLAHILGVRDPRVPFEAPELIATTTQPALVGKGKGYEVFAVRWPAFGDVHGEGLLLVPVGRKPIANVIAIPDADQTPEQFVGLAKKLKLFQHARKMAEAGCRVVVPTLISRSIEQRGRVKLTNREYLYRSAFELGRHVVGYEVQKVLALVDWLKKSAESKDLKTGVLGYAEGGAIALYAGALDTRIDAVCVAAYFDNRNDVWQEPIDRNVFGLLEQFGDAELASMIAPRKLLIVWQETADVKIPAGLGGAPGRTTNGKFEVMGEEEERVRKLTKKFDPNDWLSRTAGDFEPFGKALSNEYREAELAQPPQELRIGFDPEARQKRQIEEIDRHNQTLLRDCADVRRAFFNKLDTSSLDAYKKTVEPYRQHFAEEVIGKFDIPLQPFNARSRKTYNKEKWVGHEVVLDVFPDVIAYGVLLLPKDLKPGEKRPVVVCQHGLEGRPKDVIEGDNPAYHDFAAKLAERGFITFAPQNLYIFTDRFRTLQRKANPIKKTLFSVIVPQHQQIVNWLKTLPYVDSERIAFYGLSYGGKSAMRIPPLVTDYCLSICSADFNEWVKKNASTKAPYSYVWTGEYEIFEFDLGSTFNYAEMAALICPRPFMVERGHFDGVGVDEEVAFEFAKVRNLYQARLKMMDRTEIEWFVGPHTINGKGTYDFLHKHLNWPKK